MSLIFKVKQSQNYKILGVKSKNCLILMKYLKFTMITKRDAVIALIISTGSFAVTIGVIGMKNFTISILFFIIPLIVTLVLFWIFKPKPSNQKWEY